MNPEIRAVLFDLDDTLLENNVHRFVQGYFDLLTPYLAGSVAPERIVPALLHATFAMIGNGDPSFTNQQAFIGDFCPRVGLGAEEVMPLFDAFYASQYDGLRSLTRPHPQARAVVQIAFDAGCDVIVATNPIYPETAIRKRMEWAGVADFPFKLVTSYEVMHSTKPNPRYYAEISERIGRSPRECVMVGDDWDNDIAPAMKAGLQIFWTPAGTGHAADVDPDDRGTLADFGARLLKLREAAGGNGCAGPA